MVSHNNSKSNRSQKGAVLAESLLAIPFILIILGGVLEAGRLLGEVTWLHQTAYHSALLGGQMLDGAGQPAMEFRKTQLCNIQDEALDGPCNTDILNYDATNNLVQVEMNADIKPLNRIFPLLNIDVSVTAPHLVGNDLLNNNLSQFVEPDTRHDCTENPTGSYAGAACRFDRAEWAL